MAKPAPSDAVLRPAVDAVIDARHRMGRWATAEGDFVTDMVAIALANVPDGWAKLGGEWVQVEDWRIDDPLDRDLHDDGEGIVR